MLVSVAYLGEKKEQGKQGAGEGQREKEFALLSEYSQSNSILVT
jgi:hypothetical protein